MAQKNIFAHQTVNGFFYNSTFGVYMYNIIPATLSLQEGESYKVLWDDVAYERTAVAYTSAEGQACIGVGNNLITGGENSGEPFAIVYNADMNYLHFFSLDAAESHVIAIYQGKEAGIILKDRDGNSEVYNGVEVVKFNTTDGGTQTFIKGERATMEVAVDFSAGDMAVIPEDGKLLTGLTIFKPANLVPENIPKDVEIAGVIGTMEASGGGDENVVFFNDTVNMAPVKTLTTTITIPKNAKNIDVLYTTYQTYGISTFPTTTMNQQKNTEYNHTITETDTAIDVTYTWSISTTSSKYFMICAMSVFFTIEGFMIKKVGDDYVAYANSNVNELPDSNNTPLTTKPITIVDLSDSKIKNTPYLMFNYCNTLKKIIFPSTIENIYANAFKKCPNLEVVDLTRCTSVPILGSSFNTFDLHTDNFQILVPAALYDQFCVASQWSNLVDHLVAV